MHHICAFLYICKLFNHEIANCYYFFFKTGITGAICVLDDEPTTTGRHCGQIDQSVCQSKKVSFSIAVMVQPESGPVCLIGTEFQKKVCWEILVAGSEQGIEAGQVGLRLITKGDRQTTVAKEWSISATSIADGRFVQYLLCFFFSEVWSYCFFVFSFNILFNFHREFIGNACA